MHPSSAALTISAEEAIASKAARATTPTLAVHPAPAASNSDLHRAKLGDANAFAALVNAYYPRCLRFARNMLGNMEDAEEAVQDTFVRVHGALSRYREEERFEPWLFRILANRCRTSRSRAVRHARVIAYVGTPQDADTTARADGGVNAWTDELHKALAMLPAEQREAFLLRHVEGLMYEDMSAATGVGVSALKMRVKRACDFLRVRLREVDRD
jgi:RNA polymerase sigma-70 factor (ECF subfamily)